MADAPSALQLRLLQTVMAVAAEKNSTLVLPIPVELLRFLERGQDTPSEQGGEHTRRQLADRAPKGLGDRGAERAVVPRAEREVERTVEDIIDDADQK